MTTTELSVPKMSGRPFRRAFALSTQRSGAAIPDGIGIDMLAEQHRPGEALTSPADTQRYLRIRLAEYKNEVFGCLFLDNRHRIIEVAELFQGTIDGASVHPRVVVQKALECNAAALLLFHNHPSRCRRT